MCAPQTSQVDVKLVSKTSGRGKATAPGNSVRRDVPCINFPGDYSGDVWHVAAAMVLWCDLHVIITKQNNTPDTKEDDVSRNFQQFLSDIGIAKDRVHVAIIGNLDIETQTQGWEQRLRDVETVKRHRDGARQQRKRLGLPDGEVYPVYASTYIWVSAIRQFGTDRVLHRIQAAFVNNFEARDSTSEVAAAIRKTIGVLAASKSPFLLVNLRVSNYHPEDNTTREIYEELSEYARKNKLRLVLIGGWSEKKKEHLGPEGIWMRDLAGETVPIYTYRMGVGSWSDWQSVAYVWLQLSRITRCLGVIGGRSGSLDIAGMMGHRLLCWTIFRPEDPGYQRVQLMVVPPGSEPSIRPFISILDYNKIDPSRKVEQSLTPELARVGSTISEVAISCFRKTDPATFAPKMGGRVILRDDQLHEFIRVPGLLLCERLASDAAAVSCAALPSELGEFNARQYVERKFVVGWASGDGNNCLLHSLRQLKYGPDPAQENPDAVPEAVRTMRETLRETIPSIAQDEMLGIYDQEGTQLLRDLGLLVRVIEITNNGYILEGPPIGDVTIPEWRTQYLLFRNAHYTPMWIRGAFADPRSVARDDLAQHPPSAAFPAPAPNLASPAPAPSPAALAAAPPTRSATKDPTPSTDLDAYFKARKDEGSKGPGSGSSNL